MKITEAITFDDILLKPKYSTVESRSQVNLSVEMPKDFKFYHPIIPANMRDIVGLDMIKALYKSKGLSILHRFMPIEEQINILKKLKEEFSEDVLNYCGFSVGVKEEAKKNTDLLIEAGAKIICIDIAHGHSSVCIDMCKYISSKYPKVLLIAGNVATGEGAYDLWKAGADIVKINVGAGCFAAGTRVLMSNGLYKNIEDIIPGDYVINMHGKPVKVIDAFCTGVKKVMKIKNNSFYDYTYATPDHNFYVGDYSTIKNISQTGYIGVLDKLTKKKQSKYKWKELRDLNKDIFLFPKNIEFEMPKTFEIEIKKQNLDLSITSVKLTPSYELGYIFGTFLGDGCAQCPVYKGNKRGKINWYFGLNENNITDKIQKYIKNIFDREILIKQKKNMLLISFNHKPFAEFLKTFGKKENKHLPENLFVNNKEYLKGIRDGLIDSYGNIEKNARINFTNTSKYLIELFNLISFILDGALPNNNLKKITTGNLNNINIENCKQAFASRILQNTDYRLTKDFFVVKKLSIDETEIEVPVYDITVDCKTHSFIANNMIVHNSVCSTRLEAGAGVPQLSALIDVYQTYELSKDFFKDHCSRDISIIADGGAKIVGDLVKSLCFAHMVMTGNMISGAPECPGHLVEVDGKLYKRYEGSSTHKEKHIEGFKALVPLKPKVEDILEKMFEGIKSGCAYQGAFNLDELKKDPRFVKITSAGIKENGAHDVVIK